MPRAVAGTAPPSAQGTMGGKPTQGAGVPGKRNVVLGSEVYLWILVGIEVALIAWFRAAFSRYHGG